MKNVKAWFPVFALAVAVALGLGAVKTALGCEGCDKIAENDGTGWCDHCGSGMYHGEAVACKGCFDAMMSPGKCAKCGVMYAGGEKTKCEGCVKAAKSDGWCDHCKAGFVHNHKTGCKSCYDAMKKDEGTCESCDMRFVKGEVVTTYRFKVTGMTCGNCVGAVKGKMEGVKGVTKCTVDLKSGEATVWATSGAEPAEICASLEGTTFKAEEMAAPPAEGHDPKCCGGNAHTMEMKKCEACGKEGAVCKLCAACADAKGMCSHCKAAMGN